MALTKIGKEGITGISNASDATFLTATSGEGVTLAGTLAVTGVHTVGNNAIYTSDGGNVTQNTVQGLIKCWVNIVGTGTAGFRDSFNTSSFGDTGEGNATTTFTNNMSNDDFSAPVAGQDTVQRGDVHTSFEEQTTSTLRIMHFEGGGARDCVRIGAIVAGDLA
tara:strand:+ start:10 stop:501 length:492 start_codon:yes stop_codon:yes gene_type:complete